MNFASISPTIIDKVETEYIKPNLPTLEVGDYVKIGVLIQEGSKQRIQSSSGVIISKKKNGINTSITVRNSLQGVGVERIFLLNSPSITDIKVFKKSKVRRAKLYYLRSRFGKAARLKTRFT